LDSASEGEKRKDIFKEEECLETTADTKGTENLATEDNQFSDEELNQIKEAEKVKKKIGRPR
jgi:hypothetical protein